MRLPNSLYNWGRVLITVVVGAIIAALLHSEPIRLYALGMAILAALVILIEVFLAALSGKDPFYWWRK